MESRHKLLLTILGLLFLSVVIAYNTGVSSEEISEDHQ